MPSFRVGGFTFAEHPGCCADSARLLWSRAFDPGALKAIGPRSAFDIWRTPSVLRVVSGTCHHLVIGDPLHGIRIDCHPADVDTLLFEIAVAPALPVQLAELRRLWSAIEGTAIGHASARSDKYLLALRTLDALVEGASLRLIGEHLVDADAWPGEGDWVKSRARRLVEMARTTWSGGPRGMLAAGPILSR